MRIGTVLPASLLTGVIAASLPAKAVLADDAPDRTTMAACVEQHFTPADAGTMTRLTVMILLDAQTDAKEFRAALADKRDAAIADAARLITRLAEQDCKPQVQAVNAVAPSGFLFKSLFQQLMVLGARSLQGEDAKRAGAVLALDLVKKLDSSVAVDLFGTNGKPATAAASTSTVPNTARVSTETTL